MSCRYYGYSPLVRVEEFVNTHGDQCGLMFDASTDPPHPASRCRMEASGQAADFEHCELNGSARAEQCAGWYRLGDPDVTAQ